MLPPKAVTIEFEQEFTIVATMSDVPHAALGEISVGSGHCEIPNEGILQLKLDV